MTIITDKVIVPNGTDFTFVCKKIPFAISCLSDMPHKDANLVDLDLINKMGIPLRNIKVTRMCLLGHDVRAVGRIKQTIQCVSKGRVQGTIHLEAKVGQVAQTLDLCIFKVPVALDPAGQYFKCSSTHTQT